MPKWKDGNGEREGESEGSPHFRVRKGKEGEKAPREIVGLGEIKRGSLIAACLPSFDALAAKIRL